ncbi:MAG: hypothetical protein IJH05_08165 [Firmicutes bacterium]|nr:hypothetical protein [Bacillota bacterium]
MENKKTPASTTIFYIIGIILLIVSAFMLVTAITYTKTYLQSYDASFSDMWSNSIQYIITQFVPYLGMGVICLGLGRAIKGSAVAKAAAPKAEAKAEEKTEENAAEAQLAEEAAALKEALSDADEGKIEDLIRRIDTNREVLSIKIEEKEKRDSYRIKELEKKVEDFLADVKYINEPLEELVYKQAAGVDETEEIPAPAEAAAEVAEAGAVPQIFRMARNLTMPQCPAVKAAAETAAETAEVGAVPQIFRVARTLTMPQCPAVKATAEAEETAEVGAVPQIFRVARNMTMPAV